MFDETTDGSQDSYWPSVSDLFMTLFIVVTAILFAVYYVLIPKHNVQNEEVIREGDGVQLAQIRDPINQMRTEALGRPESDLLRPTNRASAVVSGLGDTAGDVVSEVTRLKGEIAALNKKLDFLTTKITKQNTEISELEEDLKDEQKKRALAEVGEEEAKKLAEALDKKLLDEKPLVRIDDAENKIYRFDTGKATMTQEFKAGLEKTEFQTLAAEILKRNSGEVINVDTLEIIGHTDGGPFSKSVGGNLDDVLPRYLAGKIDDMSALEPGSNNDLGLLRALAIKRAWKIFTGGLPEAQQRKLDMVDVRCYSAGQTAPESGDLSDPDTYKRDDSALRRIEIRLTRRGRDPKLPSGKE